MGKLRKRMSFSRIEEILDMPDLIEVQKTCRWSSWTSRWTSPKILWNAARKET